MDQCRKKYGQFSCKEWYNLLKTKGKTMKNLEVKTTNTISKKSFYKCNLSNVKVFLRHEL